MRIRFLLPALLSIPLLLSCKEEGDLYINPVLDRNFPDPTLLDNRARDGWFYAYSTQSVFGDSLLRIPILRSRNLTDWEVAGSAFTKGNRPGWEPKGSLWAPDINYSGGKYILFYSMGVWGDHDRSASGVAVSDSPTGPFTDLGMIVRRDNTGVGNSIDADFFEDTDGKKYLYWGSLAKGNDEAAGRKSGIHVVELSADGLSLLPGTVPVKVAGDHMEGTTVHKKGRYYYLFASEGSCCEKEKSTYHIVVGRSSSPKGPFVSRSGMPMTAGDDGIYDGTILKGDEGGMFRGPGHCSGLVRDDAGADWMLMHSYWQGNGYAGRLLNLVRVRWTRDGWPYFEGGVLPDTAPGPVFRK